LPSLANPARVRDCSGGRHCARQPSWIAWAGNHARPSGSVLLSRVGVSAYDGRVMGRGRFKLISRTFPIIGALGCVAVLSCWAVSMRAPWWWDVFSDERSVFEIRFSRGYVEFFSLHDDEGRALERMAFFPHRRPANGQNALVRAVPARLCLERKRGQTSRFSSLTIPLWLPLLLSAVFPISWVLLRSQRLRRRYLASGCCATCGYDLRGARAGRCPECGTAYAETGRGHN